MQKCIDLLLQGQAEEAGDPVSQQWHQTRQRNWITISDLPSPVPADSSKINCRQNATASSLLTVVGSSQPLCSYRRASLHETDEHAIEQQGQHSPSSQHIADLRPGLSAVCAAHQPMGQRQAKHHKRGVMQ